MNHYRWIVWKLAAQERRFPNTHDTHHGDIAGAAGRADKGGSIDCARSVTTDGVCADAHASGASCRTSANVGVRAKHVHRAGSYSPRFFTFERVMLQLVRRATVEFERAQRYVLSAWMDVRPVCLFVCVCV